MNIFSHRLVRRALPLLKFGTEIVDKIPTSSDTGLQKLAKVLALLDAASKVYGGNGGSRMRELTDRWSLVERESETFVKLFFSTTLRDSFTLHRYPLDDREDLIEAVGVDGSRMFFRETHYGSSRVESDFYASHGINLHHIVDVLWERYPDGIYLSITLDGWRKETLICEVPRVPAERLSTHARERLDATVERHRGFMADGVHRCYLLFGPAGSGKSSFAVLFSRALGGRALKLDATSLPILSVKEIGFLLDMLRPGVLVVEDIDRAPLAEVGPRVLFLLERLKARYPGMTIILSVNDATKLDSALLRCGRIDVPIEFTAPPCAEAEQMVADLLVAHGVPAARATPAVISQIIDMVGAEHLTHAYLDDLCRRLRHEEPADVIASVMLLKMLADKSQEKSEEKKP